ncbi:MAG: DUF2157 domain-containing protein, partial [Bacteroidota bacterium]
MLDTHIYPQQPSWRRFLKISMLTLGVGFLVAGIVFFFAYNWDSLPNQAKLIITQSLVVITCLPFFIPRVESIIKNISLTASALLPLTSGRRGYSFSPSPDPSERSAHRDLIREMGSLRSALESFHANTPTAGYVRPLPPSLGGDDGGSPSPEGHLVDSACKRDAPSPKGGGLHHLSNLQSLLHDSQELAR